MELLEGDTADREGLDQFVCVCVFPRIFDVGKKDGGDFSE